MKAGSLRPRPALAFAALSVACLAVVGAYVLATLSNPVRRARRAGMAAAAATADTGPAANSLRPNPHPSSAHAGAAAPRPPAPAIDQVSARRAGKAGAARTAVRRLVLFRSAALDDTYLKLSSLALERLDQAATTLDLRCERVHYAARYGVCLWAKRGMFTTYGATLLDDELRPVRTIPLAGSPSRVRVSADGRFAAITVFVTGHSYAASSFSTRTTILNVRTGDEIISDLETLAISRDGEPFSSIDFNLWGVTFTRDSNRFFATLATGGRTHLIEGDIHARTARVVRPDVECPSLSPDNRRIAFKKRHGSALGPVAWRLTVLDLSTNQEWPLAETRNVDDQVEWLDADHILYSLPDERSPAVINTWRLPADGTGAPQLFLARAYSAVVVTTE